jgi:hypothetical protein
MRDAMMRVLMLSAGLLLVGCASEPVQPKPNLVAVQGPVGSTAVGGNIGVTSPSIETQRLAAAKNLNLKVFSKDGQELFCRSNLVTGSHIQRDTRCFTAEQLDQLDQATQRDVDQFINRPDTQNPARLPGSH